jgi:hypothetical protein
MSDLPVLSAIPPGLLLAIRFTDHVSEKYPGCFLPSYPSSTF